MHPFSLSILFCLALFFSHLSGIAQNKFWVSFTDKGINAENLLAKPELFLSKTTCERRRLRQIGFHDSDLPVYSPYVQALVGHGAKLISRSKWLNAVVIEIETSRLHFIRDLPFVNGLWTVKTYTSSLSQIEIAQAKQSPNPLLTKKFVKNQESGYAYGAALTQVQMLHLDRLHQVGFTGKGVRIAVLDGGFRDTDKLKVFDSLRNSKRIIASYDFVRNQPEIFTPSVSSSHGTKVLSVLAAQLPDTFVGTAPDARYMLAITEEPKSEQKQEEYNWVEAVEWADSIGVDIIHSSLSYNTFDDSSEDYEWKDLDGDHAVTSIAADMAAAKGILVTTGAGNDGNSPWRRITAPCDGDSVLCVGALDNQKQRAVFSSVGPSADGQVKPDVMALGQGTMVAGPGDRIFEANGTSYSSPLVAGLAACLIQAHPTRDAMEILKAIQLSSSQATKPDSLYGYGIPHAKLADSLLRFVPDLSQLSLSQLSEQPKIITPPASKRDTLVFTDQPVSTFRIIANTLTLKTLDSRIVEVAIMYGKQKVIFPKDRTHVSDFRAVFQLEHLLPGKYYLHVETEGYEENIPFEK